MQKKYNRFKKFKNRIIIKRKEKKNKQEKRKIPHNRKSPMQRQRFITTIESVTEYTQKHVYPYAKSKQFNKYKV